MSSDSASSTSPGAPPAPWPPAGKYPGDRRYLLWGLLGVLWILIGFTSPGSPSVGGVSLFLVVGVFFAVIGVSMYFYTRRTRPTLWKSLVDGLTDPGGLRCLDVGSRDIIATAVVVTCLPDATATVVTPNAKAAAAATANATALNATDRITVADATPWDLPLADNSVDFIIGDGADQLVRRARIGEVTTQLARVAAPGARVAIVVSQRPRALASALGDAGATGVTITGAPMSWWNGYRIVQGTFPA